MRSDRNSWPEVGFFRLRAGPSFTGDHVILSPQSLGVGFYSQADAARLLKVHPERHRRWIHGYKFRTGAGAPRGSAPIVPSSLEIVAALAGRTSACDAATAYQISEHQADAAVQFEALLRVA